MRGRPPITAANESADQPLPGRLTACNESIDPEQGWQRLAPHGVYQYKDGDQVILQVVDRDSVRAMVTAFNSVSTRLSTLWRGLPIYVGHPDEPSWSRQHPSVTTEAKGRIKELQEREDGLWGRLAFNDAGRALVSGEAAAYSHQSPRWAMVPITYQGKRAYRPVSLVSIGLTNTPNIPGTYVGLNEALEPAATNPMNKHLIDILAALGVAVPADPTEEQALTAVNEALPLIATLKSSAASAEQLTAQVATLTTAANECEALRGQVAQLGQQVAAAAKARAEQLVTVAINEGRLTPAQRQSWLDRLVGQDAAAAESELRTLRIAVNTSYRGPSGSRRSEGSSDLSRGKQITDLVATYQREHPAASYDDSWAAVKKDNPNLFS